MKTLALALAVATTIAAPAFADGHTSNFAVMHFNMDEDSNSDRRMVPTGLTQVQLTPGSTLSEVFGHLNMDADVSMNVAGQGTGGVTIIMSDPSQAAAIFARLMAESAEDE